MLLNKKMLVYPNPVNDHLYIFVSSGVIKNICVYDISGKLVYQDLISSSIKETKLNLSFLDKGAYLIRVQTNDKVYVEKIIKW